MNITEKISSQCLNALRISITTNPQFISRPFEGVGGGGGLKRNTGVIWKVGGGGGGGGGLIETWGLFERGKGGY